MPPAIRDLRAETCDLLRVHLRTMHGWPGSFSAHASRFCRDAPHRHPHRIRGVFPLPRVPAGMVTSIQGANRRYFVQALTDNVLAGLSYLYGGSTDPVDAAPPPYRKWSSYASSGRSSFLWTPFRRSRRSLQ